MSLTDEEVEALYKAEVFKMLSRVCGREIVAFGDLTPAEIESYIRSTYTPTKSPPKLGSVRFAHDRWERWNNDRWESIT